MIKAKKGYREVRENGRHRIVSKGTEPENKNIYDSFGFGQFEKETVNGIWENVLEHLKNHPDDFYQTREEILKQNGLREMTKCYLMYRLGALKAYMHWTVRAWDWIEDGLTKEELIEKMMEEHQTAMDLIRECGDW